MSDIGSEELKVYLAGDLFDVKHLTGNAMLAEAIEIVSDRRYKMLVPQDIELPSMEAKDIRDEDFRALLECDAAVFQFDGPDLDSGTVAEFMAAKFADLPSVVLRTDFRRGGDRNDKPWNLMCNFYPRTEYVVMDALGAYAASRAQTVERQTNVEAALGKVASDVVEKLDAVMGMEPVLSGDEKASVRGLLDRILT
ncbi:MAG: nucleoside 2-deoxyribosyltransferase [Verrucomicrobiota bacterium]